MDLAKVNRVEVIDGNGRSYVYDPRSHPGETKVSLSLQDEGRTLKVFIKAPPRVVTPQSGP